MLDFRKLSRELKGFEIIDEITDALFDEGERIRKVLDKQGTSCMSFKMFTYF